MQSVLVTGGTGFIGRHLVSELVRQGRRVRCFVRPSSSIDHLSTLDVEIISGDLIDLDDVRRAIAGVETVFHVAGLTHAVHPHELERVNGMACGVWTEACRRVPNPPRFLYVSSLSAAGPTAANHPPIVEQDGGNPVSNYGNSKRHGEMEIQKRAADLPCTVIRPGIVFGPHDPGTKLILRPIYHQRVHLVVGFKTPPLSLIYIEDLVQLLLRAEQVGERLEGSPDGGYSSQGYYFACDDAEHPTYWQLGERFARALNRRVIVWPVWHWVGRAIGGVCQFTNRMQGKSSLLNVDKIREATASSWACSAEKARRQLDFAPAHDLDTSLKSTAQWYLRSVKGG